MNLSQDEINALLNGNTETEPTGEADGPVREDLGDDDFPFPADGGPDPADGYAPAGGEEIFAASQSAELAAAGYALAEDDIDILGEVGNMCMGAVATTMYTLLGRPVSITTPRVSVHTAKEVLAVYRIPFVVVEVEYTEGIEGKNLLVLKKDDAVLITNLLMGGDGVVEQPVELDELHMSAISEIMNQMMGASATSLSKLLDMPVNISPPISQGIDADNDVSGMLDHSSVVIKISFDMEIEGLLKSELLQVLPYQLGMDLSSRFKRIGMGAQAGESQVPESFLTTSNYVEPEPEPEPIHAPPEPIPAPPEPVFAPPEPIPAPLAPAAHDYSFSPPPADQAPRYAPPPPPGNLVDVHPVQYQSFDQSPPSDQKFQKGMDLVSDIPLNVTVELGRAKRAINEILKMGIGTLIVLDKTAGDPVEVIVNGKLIAKGEVVVIDDNYGVRITEILGG
jgi:flagellar motor switch protein FliN/FliY